ncbi:hypothetical protein UFOVP817_18 [uncultured Caudovirales phage]|uniref:Uncharacterized protein n=1 Tax=uncultured Caudovirales phage TaxID=2100421 RepID=A0A6J5P0U5_9CAUD|nr:hypothetical protein UFOVP817_18 [uncultured Caudovirales phage]
MPIDPKTADLMITDFGAWENTLDEAQRQSLENTFRFEPDRVAAQKRFASVANVAAYTGQDVEEVSSRFEDYYMHAFARDEERGLALAGGVKDANEFYGLLTKRAKNNTIKAETLKSASSAAFDSALRGGSDMADFAAWQVENEHLPEAFGEARKVWAKTRADVEKELGPDGRAAASRAFRAMRSITGASQESDAWINEAKSDLINLRVRSPKAYKLALAAVQLMAADAGRVEKGVAQGMGENAGRVISDIGASFLFARPIVEMSQDASETMVKAGLTNAENPERLAAQIRARREVENDIRDISRGVIDPVKSESEGWAGWAENAAYVSASSLPLMASVMIPGGTSAASGSFTSISYNYFRRNGWEGVDAAVASVISGVFQAAVEKSSEAIIKIPGVAGVLNKFGVKPGSSWAAQFFLRSGMRSVVELTEEIIQEATAPFIQELANAIMPSIPDTPEGKHLSDVMSSFFEADNFAPLVLAVVPLGVIGAGMSTSQDMDVMEDARRFFGDQAAAEIMAETDPAKRDAMIREKFNALSAADIARIARDGMNQSIVSAEAQRQFRQNLSAEAAKVGITMYRDDQGWKVQTISGKIISVDSEEAAERYVTDLRLSGEEYEAESTIALADELVKAFPGTRLELSPSEMRADQKDGLVLYNPVTEQTTVIKDAKSLENLWREASAVQSGSRVPQLVLGDNFMEFGQSIARVFRRGRGSNDAPAAITAMHEVIEAAWRKGVMTGQWTVEGTRQILATIAPTLEAGIAKLGKDAQAQELLWLNNLKKAAAEGDEDLVREVFVEMAVRTWIGRDRDGRKTGLKPGVILRALNASVLQESDPENITIGQKVIEWFKSIGAYLKGVIATANIIRSAERDGLIDDFTGFLDEVLGLEASAREEAEVKQDVQDMAFSLAPEMRDGASFSISPVSTVSTGGLSEAEAEIKSMLPTDVRADYQKFDDRAPILWRGETTFPAVRSVKIIGADSSGKSRSIYPSAAVTLANGGVFVKRFRVSDHAQVSETAFRQYDLDYRLTRERGETERAFDKRIIEAAQSDLIDAAIFAWEDQMRQLRPLVDAEYGNELKRQKAAQSGEFEIARQIDDTIRFFRDNTMRPAKAYQNKFGWTYRDGILKDAQGQELGQFANLDAARFWIRDEYFKPSRAADGTLATFSLSPASGIDIVSDTLESWQDVFDKAAKRNPTRAMAIRDLAQQRINRLGEMWAADRWTAKGDKIRAVVEKRTKSSLDDEQAMREALALDQILEAEGMNSAAAMRSKDSKDYEAWQRFQESKALILSKGEFTEEEAEKLAGASSSAWRKAFVSSIREAVKKAKAEAAAWRQEADDMQADDWSPRESLVRDMRVLNVALSAFPPEVRAKITGGSMVKLAGLATERARYKAIQKALEKAIVETEVFMRKEYTEQVDNALDTYRSQKDSSGRISGKLPSQYTELVDYAYRIREASIEDQATESGGLEKALEESESDQQTQSVLTKMGILRLFEAWEMKDSTAMAAASEWLSETIENGKLGRKLLNEERKAMMDELRATAKKDAVPEGKISKVDVDNETNQIRFKVFRRAWQGLNGMLDSAIHTFLQRLELVFGEDSKIADYFITSFIRAANASNDIKRGVNAKYHDMLSVVFNSRSRLAHARGIGQMQKVKNSGVMITEGRKVKEVKLDIETLTKLADGDMTAEAAGLRQDQVDAALEEWAASERKRTVTVEVVENAGEQKERQMTELQGVQWWLWSRQEASRKQMERDGWTEESLKQLDAFLSPQAKALGEWIAASYDDAARLIDPVYRRLFNAPLPRVKNYAPIYRNRSGDASVMDLDASDISSGLAAAFINSRVNTVSPLAEMDAVTVMLTHWNNVAHWVTHAEAVRDAKAVLLDRDVMTAVKQKSGLVSSNSIKQRIAAIESQGTTAARELHDLNRFWKWLIQYRAYKSLAFRISPVIKQTPALLNPLLADVPAHSYTVGLARAFYDPDAFARDVSAMFESDVIQRRIEGGFSAEARIATQGEGAAGSVALAWMQRGMMPMAWTDGGWTALGAAVSFDYYKRGYMAENPQASAAMADAYATKRLEKMIATSAQPADIVNRSLVEASSNPFMRSLWMFASDPRKALGIEVTALKKLLSGKSKNKAMDIQRIIVAHFAQAAMFQLMASILASFIGDDEDKDREWSREQWALSLTLGPINGLFVFGRLIDMAARRVLGLRIFPGGNLVEKAADDLVRGGKSMDELFNPDDPEDFINAMDALAVGASGVMSMAIGPQAGVVDVTANLVREGNKVLKAATREE